tara:strand:- start:486 stop:716 length:231 start_codon:yes stop_codon:yes gene_type:complete
MTRKHYEKVAKALRDYRIEVISEFGTNTEWTNTKIEVMEDIAQILSDIFQGDNELFNSNKFLGACIPNDDELTGGK